MQLEEVPLDEAPESAPRPVPAALTILLLSGAPAAFMALTVVTWWRTFLAAPSSARA